ncbi:response regulator [Rothia sp. P6271]|uniref:response regulator n=1 Tax=unclassified Rothia (in: high G+C Gram-positive bacteria) TaxID=2689056 RepID=UPI003ACD1DB6
MSAETIRVLLADDQDLVRNGFSMILSVEENIHVVGEAHNGQEAVDLCLQLKPDVVLMDVQMPVLDGINATLQIVQQTESKVLVLTTFDRDDYLFGALNAGASGFLLKTCTAEKLVEAIEQVHGGLALLSPEVTLPVIQKITVASDFSSLNTSSAMSSGASSNVSGCSAEDRLRVESLTARERETLSYLAKGLTNAEIAEQMFLGSSTVKTHVSNVLAKTHSRDRVNAVIFAYRTGLVH